MTNKELEKKLKKFLNEAFYIHSKNQALKIWTEISAHVPEPYCTRINLEFTETGCTHGREQSCAALADEVNKFIKTL